MEQRKALAAQLRALQQNTSIGQDLTVEIASGIIKELRTEARATEELKEELTTDLSSGIISTTASDEELRASDSGSDSDEVQDLDETRDLPHEISSATLDCDQGNDLLEPGGNRGGHISGSSWGYTPHTTLWGGFTVSAVLSLIHI